MLFTYLNRVFTVQKKVKFSRHVSEVLPSMGRETWAVKEEDLAKLERNDMMMVQWMCHVTLKE